MVVSPGKEPHPLVTYGLSKSHPINTNKIPLSLSALRKISRVLGALWPGMGHRPNICISYKSQWPLIHYVSIPPLLEVGPTESPSWPGLCQPHSMTNSLSPSPSLLTAVPQNCYILSSLVATVHAGIFWSTVPHLESTYALFMSHPKGWFCFSHQSLPSLPLLWVNLPFYRLPQNSSHFEGFINCLPFSPWRVQHRS